MFYIIFNNFLDMIQDKDILGNEDFFSPRNYEADKKLIEQMLIE